jgi:hypothetical protein
VREIAPEFLEIILAQDFRIAVIGTPSHAAAFYNVRVLFA